MPFNMLSKLPNVPAVCAMYGGRGRGLHVAYVGIADVLRRRVMQHLVSRDSSVATGTSAAGLNPDHITEVWWCEHPDFAQRHVLEAAELVAFDVLQPVLRSRGAISDRAKQLHSDGAFREKMRLLFLSEPKGRVIVPTLQDLLQRIAELEQRLATLEKRVEKK